MAGVVPAQRAPAVRRGTKRRSTSPLFGAKLRLDPEAGKGGLGTMRTHTASGRNSILGSYVKAVGRALDAAGCNGAALLAEAGFDLKDLDGPDARCPLVNTGHLWRIAVAATGDPAFGIKVANHYKHTTFHALGYGTSASSTLKEAFERVQRYCHVVSDAVEYQ